MSSIEHCIKCGNNDILIYNSKSIRNNLSGCRCKNCGHDIQVNSLWNEKEDYLITIWNRENNLTNYVSKLESQKSDIQKEIDRVNNLFKKEN